MALACKVIPAMDNSAPAVTIVLHSSGKPLKMQGSGGVYLIPQPQCIGSIRKDHHMQVIKLPSSIMNGTISRDSGLLLCDG